MGNSHVENSPNLRVHEKLEPARTIDELEPARTIDELINPRPTKRNTVFVYFTQRDDTMGDFLPYLILAEFLLSKEIQVAFHLNIISDEFRYRDAYDTALDGVRNLGGCVTTSVGIEEEEELKTLYDKLELCSSVNIVGSGEIDIDCGDTLHVVSLKGDRRGWQGSPRATAMFSFLSPVWEYKLKWNKVVLGAGTFLRPLSKLGGIPKEMQVFCAKARKEEKTIVGFFASMPCHMAGLMKNLLRELPEDIVFVGRSPDALDQSKWHKSDVERVWWAKNGEYVEFGAAVQHVDVWGNQMGHGSVTWGVLRGKPQVRLPVHGGATAVDKHAYENKLIEHEVAPEKGARKPDNYFPYLLNGIQHIKANLRNYRHKAQKFQTEFINMDVGQKYLDGKNYSKGLDSAFKLLI